MMVSGSTMAAGKFFMERYEGSVKRENLLGGARAQRKDTQGRAKVTGPVNILMVGVDTRTGAGWVPNADTIMIMHIPRNLSSAYLFSIPRDTVVDIPAFPRAKFRGATEKINSAFAYGYQNGGNLGGGVELLANTLMKMTGLTGFDASAIIDFQGFTRVVGALGGVQMCVDAEVKSIHTGMVFKKGCQQFNGHSALDYVRQRYTLQDGDYGRQRHQQQFIKAIIKQAMKTEVVTSPSKLDAVIRAAGSSLTVDDNGIPITDWALALRNITDTNLSMIKIPGHTMKDRNGGYRGEELDPVAKELFTAVRTEQIDAFLTKRPDLKHQ